ncbi:MAG: DUF4112 domain-containing protein [Hyphomonadaceae bacterium]
MPNKCDDVARLKRLEQALERKFSIFGIKVGYDGLAGLVPVVGDIATAGVGLYFIFEARRLGAHRWTVARMLVNWGFDLGVGAVPVLGDIFDIAYRSNTKNLRLLIGDLERRASRLREVNREQLQLRAAA